MADQDNTAIESEARELGWVPQEEFRGDESRWVDAKTFVERGRTVMPLLKKTNERLEGLVQAQAREMAELKGRLNSSQEAIEELKAVHRDATKAAVEKARKDLLAELKEVKQSGDVDREIEITEELSELRAVTAPAASKPAPTPTPAKPADNVHPDFAGWLDDNKWFGVDERRTLRAMGIAQQLRSDPENDSLQGRKFFDKVLEVMDGAPRGPAQKVGESRGTSSGGTGGSGRRTYADLPPDAKEACDRQAKKLVGPDRAFKDAAAWRAHYVNIYYQDEA